MKRNQLLLVSILAFALQGGASLASAERAYPPDTEASSYLRGLEAPDRHVRTADGTEIWGVGRRHVHPHDPFPFGGGYIDD